MLSERILYHTRMVAIYYTRMVIPYAYGIQNCTIRVRYIPYANSTYHTRMVRIKYAYGTEQHHQNWNMTAKPTYASAMCGWTAMKIHLAWK